MYTHTYIHISHILERTYSTLLTLYLDLTILYTDMRSFFDTYDFKLTACAVPPQKQTSTPLPGLVIRHSTNTNTNNNAITSLTHPMRDADIAILQSLYNSNSIYNTSSTHNNSQYFIPAEHITVRNDAFTHTIENDIKINIVYKFCENMDPTRFSTSLLGGRLIVPPTVEVPLPAGSSADASKQPMGGEEWSMAGMVGVPVSAGVSAGVSAEAGRWTGTGSVAGVRHGHDDNFCATICIQVSNCNIQVIYLFVQL